MGALTRGPCYKFDDVRFSFLETRSRSQDMFVGTILRLSVKDGLGRVPLAKGESGINPDLSQ